MRVVVVHLRHMPLFIIFEVRVFYMIKTYIVFHNILYAQFYAIITIRLLISFVVSREKKRISGSPSVSYSGYPRIPWKICTCYTLKRV